MKKVLSIFTIITMLFLSVGNSAVQAYSNDDLIISDFLSTCDIQTNDEVYITENIKSNFENMDTYLIVSSNKIIGILNEENSQMTYTDLSDKSINKIEFQNIETVKYTDLNTYIFFDDKMFDLGKDTITIDFEVDVENNTVLNKVHLIKKRGSSKNLNVPKYKQDTSYTCWATCIASVAKYKGKPYVAPKVISKNYGIDPNKRGATIGETKGALKYQFGINSTVVSKGPSAMEIINLINANKPIITGFLADIYGHMCVIKGYSQGSSYLSVSYMDPASGSYRTTQVTTDRKIQFKIGNKTYTSACYLKL